MDVVTLVTGDRVTVAGKGDRMVSVEAGPDRASITFNVLTVQDHVRVVPSDAAPLLATGRLDPRLFDVTVLTDLGYGHQDHLPLIVIGREADSIAVLRSSIASIDGLRKVRELPAVNGVAVRQAHGKAAYSWRALTMGGATGHGLRAEVGKVWLDGMRKPSLDVSVPQIGAPAAWAAGYTGAGSTVAVLDTGIDDTHPDLAGQVVARQNFTDGLEPDGDVVGHGTHVAATVASTGAASGGRYKGVAPGAKLLDGKVCVVFGCAESWIIAGMTWAAAEQHAKVVNLSLGGPDNPDEVDPVEQAVQTLSDQYGTLFVIAAGNTDGGIIEGAIASPGTAEAALTVGAVNRDGNLVDFSRRGPRAPDEGLKPDITGPGVGITAARGKDAVEVPGRLGDRYTTLSGTSMATPHVAGGAAILAQQHQGWTGQQLKAVLMSSARPNQTFGVFAQGAGRIDVAKAIVQSVTSNPASIGFGKQMWPHPDDLPRTRNVTYRNHGSAQITLALRIDAFVPGGGPAPAGMFTTSATSVQVPAGGEATVAVTADTRITGSDGYIGGWLIASSGDVMVRTPVGVNKEVESYDVTVMHLDRAGSTPTSFMTMLARRDNDSVPLVWFGPDPDNSPTFRLPKAHYTIISSMTSSTGPGPKTRGTGSAGTLGGVYSVLLAQPDLFVGQPRNVNLDARLAQPISVTVPRASALQFYAQMGASTLRPHGTAGIVSLGDSFASMYSARIGPDHSDDNFRSGVAGQWAQLGPDGSLWDSPEVYALQFREPGRMITGYNRRVTYDELARVHAHIAAADPGTTGLKRIQTFIDDAGTYSAGLEFHLPFSRVEYYNTGPGVGAWGQFATISEAGDPTAYQAGFQVQYRSDRVYHEQWNQAVFAPGTPTGDWEGATRTGDQILVDMPMYSDAVGRAGGSADRRTSTLFRDGTKIAETDLSRFLTFDVPSATARYRLEIRSERLAPSVFSTRTNIAWTFSSGHVEPGARLPLPLWTIRFKPDVDRYNTAPASRMVAVPMVVATQTGAPAGQLAGLTVEASFDGGVTWNPVQINDGSALVKHPRGSGFVSLRATATDTQGNALEESIIHAYRYGPTT